VDIGRAPVTVLVALIAGVACRCASRIS